MTRLNKMLLPAGVTAQGHGLCGSIDWATPAYLGVSMAKTSGRTIMVTGDGSHQLTLNELGPMGRYKAKPVIFVLNNGLYGVEDVISERGHPYDDLAKVNYHLLPQAFGCEGWLTMKVGTVAELEAALAKDRDARRRGLHRGHDPGNREPAAAGSDHRQRLQAEDAIRRLSDWPSSKWGRDLARIAYMKPRNVAASSQSMRGSAARCNGSGSMLMTSAIALPAHEAKVTQR